MACSICLTASAQKENGAIRKGNIYYKEKQIDKSKKEYQKAVELAPQNAYVRRLQHQLVERAELDSESLGVEPRRRLKILPNTLV